MDDGIERWLWVTTHVDIYEVSDLGRMRSVDRVLPNLKYGPNGTRQYRGQVKEPWVASSGHLYVELYSPRRRAAVHRLVLEAFVGPPEDGEECCHNNGEPQDNRLVNLRWDSRSANIFDMVDHGAHWQAKKTHCKRGHPLVEPNLTRCRAKDGQRNCLACGRAQSKRRYHGASVDVQVQSDYEFQLIMQGKVVGFTRTHCRKGHELTEANSIVRKGRRDVGCRICANEQARARRASQKVS